MAAAMVASVALLAVAFVSVVLVEKFECGGEEGERAPPPGTVLGDYCDAHGAFLSLLAPVVVALGWLLTRKTGKWTPMMVACALATALAVSPIVAALLWHGN
jgi:hypothetical protein